jgi:K+-transporting ATPase KdpF subunit
MPSPFSCGFNAPAGDPPANFHPREVQSGCRIRELFRMTFDLILVGLVALGLLAYLTAVLLRPERF